MVETRTTLSEQAVQELIDLLDVISCVKHKLSRMYTYWCLKGPTLEANAGIVAMILEECGHVAVLNSIKKSVTADESAKHSCHPYLEQYPKTWTGLVSNVLVFDGFFYEMLKAARSSSYEPLAMNIAKILEEEKFHCMFGGEWASLLCRSKNFMNEFQQEREKAFASLEQLVKQIHDEALVRERVIEKSVGDMLVSFRQQIEQELLAQPL